MKPRLDPIPASTRALLTWLHARLNPHHSIGYAVVDLDSGLVFETNYLVDPHSIEHHAGALAMTEQAWLVAAQRYPDRTWVLWAVDDNLMADRFRYRSVITEFNRYQPPARKRQYRVEYTVASGSDQVRRPDRTRPFYSTTPPTTAYHLPQTVQRMHPHCAVRLLGARR